MTQLGNVRLGLATNSSSSHSMILWKGKQPKTDEYSEFGWEYFVAADKSSKRNYFGQCLTHALRKHMDDWLINLVVNSVTGEDTLWTDHDGYVDHQSVWDFPATFDRKGVNIDFAQQLYQWLMDSNVAILGGNDNGGDEHPLHDGSEFKYPLELDYSYETVARWDDVYKYWTIFNHDTGARLMMRFETNEPIETSTKITRASAPMLADISITDYCPFGCAYCYRGSHTGGKNADMKTIQTIATMLEDMEVFEVAIGGGEPTLHPDFIDILKEFKSHHIVPNFTTRNLGWLKYQDLTREVMDNAGAFAVSVEEYSTINELSELIQARGISPNRVKVHIIMGTMERHKITGLIKHAGSKHIGVTLLGYKNDGRGGESKKTRYYEYESWFTDMLKELVADKKYISLSVDTPLAAQFSKEFVTKLGVPEWMYHTQEGVFSMFIDATNKTASKSSFNNDKSYPIGLDYFSQRYSEENELRKVFLSFQEE